jgi:hypothetical protein
MKDLPKMIAYPDIQFNTSFQISPESHCCQYKNEKIWQTLYRTYFIPNPLGAKFFIQGVHFCLA